jgi:hypothetical protein
MFSENTALMTLRRGRILKWFPITLALTGGLVFFAGIFIAAFSMTTPAAQQRINLPRHGAVYVGENTCYTCHEDEANDWSATLYAQTIVNPAVKPKVVLADRGAGHENLQVRMDDLADAYTTASAFAPAGNPYVQHYVIQTEEGHIVRPRPWNATGLESEAGHSEESPFFCSACHLTEFVPEILSLKAGPPALAAIPGAVTRKHITYLAAGSDPTEYAIVEGHSM